MTRISVAMATYNGARFLPQQLQSLREQTLPPAELVVTDDGSTDDTLAVLADFAATAPFPVRVERNSVRLGFRANFMKAVGMCEGELIAFCDQDDVWLPRKLERCAARFSDGGVFLVYHNATVVNEALSPIGGMERYMPPAEVNPPLTIRPWLFGLGFTQVIRRELTAWMAQWPDSVDFFNGLEREAHDQWFFFMAASLGNVEYISESLALYRRHEVAATTHQKPLTLWQKLRKFSQTDVQAFASRKQSALQRAKLLARIGQEGRHSLAAAKAQRMYQELAGFYDARIALYETRGLARRIARFAALVNAHAYRPQPCWGVGREALLRDALCGVLMPHAHTPSQPKG